MSDAWSPPAPQQFPASEPDGVRRLVGAVQDVAQRTREATKNLLRTAGVRALPGRIASLDFDGTNRANLGTSGWSLGADGDGTGSYLALNGLDVYATLQAQITTLNAQQAALSAQQTALQTQVTRIDALVNNQVTSDVGNNYVVQPISNSGWTNYAPVTIGVPVGYSRALVVGISSMVGPNTDSYAIRTDIIGSHGAEYVILGNAGSIAFTRTLTGLNGGNITISTGAYNLVASSNNRGISTSASVIFMR
jgi:hypothetical protein